MNDIPHNALPAIKNHRYRWLRLGSFLMIGLVVPFFLFSLYYYDSHLEQQKKSRKELLNLFDNNNQLIKQYNNLNKIQVDKIDVNSKLNDEVSKLISKLEPFEGNISEINSNLSTCEKEYPKPFSIPENNSIASQNKIKQEIDNINNLLSDL